MCGLPGYGPGDLIDLSFEGDRVRVTFTAGMGRPLRLTTDEAVALVVALRTLLELPGLAEREAVSRALAKVSAAAGHAADRVTPVAVSVDAREEALAVVKEGLERKRALHLHYYVPTRDERTERTVDPMRLLLVDGKWYLEAWCRRAEGVRLFRLDRVDDVVVLDEPAAPPPQAHERDVDNGVYQPEPDAPAVRLRLSRSARWVADYYPVDSVDPARRTAASAVTVRTADLAWARRLVASLGGEARVEEPADLATEIAADARAALQRLRRRRHSDVQRRRLGSPRGGADRVDRRRGPRPRRPRGDRVRGARRRRPAGPGARGAPSGTSGRCSQQAQETAARAVERRLTDPRSARDLDPNPSGVASPVPLTSGGPVMGSLGPLEIGLIILAILLLFGYKKLPDASRSLGRSLRIFKGEMKGMKDDDVAREGRRPGDPRPRRDRRAAAPGRARHHGQR